MDLDPAVHMWKVASQKKEPLVEWINNPLIQRYHYDSVLGNEAEGYGMGFRG
jgi:hypothetical protein